MNTDTNTETQRVLIVAKTRRAGGACIGAIAADGRSLRLEAANAASDAHAGSDYHVGEVWEVQFAPHPQIVPPHVETVVVYARQQLRQAVDPLPAITRFMPPLSGGIDALYGGLLQQTEVGALYIAERSGLPAQSTLFWRPDRPLQLVTNGVRLHYCYGECGEGPRLAFVGFQEPLEEIPAGAIVRVSLAHWWRPRDHPEHEARCYAQLSGWFLPNGGADGRKDGHAGAAAHAHDLHKGAWGEQEGGKMQLVQPLTRSPAHPLDEQRLRQTLRDVFGYDSFRPLQEEIIMQLLAGQDTLAVMPTGAGKSLCYQLPALLWERLTVVVSPLIALMQDQVDALRALGVSAAYLNSTLTYAEQRRLMERMRAGEIKLLYVAPETLVRPELLHVLGEAGVDCLAVDEAHCISAWGHDFRPEYRQLDPVRRRFAGAVCLAMTATAAPRVRADIKQSLGIGDAGEIVASFDRPNLFLAAKPRGSGKRELLAFLARHRSDSGIVYCTARSTVETVAAHLVAQGYAALPYHAGLEDRVRLHNQRAFVRDETPIIVATIAFGMGINKPNVRFVVHYNLPASIEQYYQEIGRAGRDGLRADCLLLYHPQDVILQAQMIDDGAEEERAGRNARLQAMRRFAEARTCRRPSLLHYFGEDGAEERCGFCDNCVVETSEQPQTDVTEAAQKFFACVQRTGQMFGAGHIIDVLRGSRSQKVLARRHDTLPLYATGKEFSAADWRVLVQQWLQQGVLEQDMEHGGLRLNERSMAVVRGEQKVFAELYTPAPAEGGSSLAGGGQGVELPAYDAGLFEHLRTVRRQLAEAANLPPYMVFSDRALIEMAAYLPRSPMEFATINGVGRVKLESYGRQLLTEIATYAEAHDLQPQPRPVARPAASPAAPRQRTGGKRAEEVGALYGEGRSLADLQSLYGVKRSTIINHLRDFQQGGGAVDAARLHDECGLGPAVQERVLRLFAELGGERLSPIYDALQGSIDYEELHHLRLVWQIQQAESGRR